MSFIRAPDQTGDVVEKVLKRAEVAKMARRLHDRLALASFKTRRGWENLPLEEIEPKVELELQRRRPRSSGETLSDSSSYTSDNYFGPAMMSSSSPTTAPLHSEDIHGSDNRHSYRKRSSNYPNVQQTAAGQPSRKRARSNSHTLSNVKGTRSTWKQSYQLPQSSPVRARRQAPFTTSHGQTLSFVSETSTIPDHASSPTFGRTSDDEDQDLPLHSFQASSARTRPSPPRTPPPVTARTARLRTSGIGPASTRNGETGEEGADLLLYLATSPSPANPGMKARVFPPSTPPSRNLALPSSMMTTPSGGAFLTSLAGPNTPSQAFNFADFVNITPSPAQGAFGPRTPAVAKTPLAAREARRKLNFDNLVPPSASSDLGSLSSEVVHRQTGLGMELGGELIS
ncbi:MAG: hypothetical protein M1817_006754 [Caeruleum heppii]|nr:MAG: hypothetical protein M1817_006754 [Caeruleum heppii]